ncbi:hypothetical protein AVEN_155657-1 [Araneus ventricosus]|uniref:Uncharacterized protein n=1 Tax=Araneus ventricosus TaxID=182803 RepID=A0A4Y2RJV6_ARAVE|nr:hypothetical protein AVEN_155657-1 [Araneus ventricosus]
MNMPSPEDPVLRARFGVEADISVKTLAVTSEDTWPSRERGCSITEVANYGNVGQDCGNGTKALDSTEKTIEGTKKTPIIWDLDGKDWFLFGESGANYVSVFLLDVEWLATLRNHTG